jgi:hypothetical protein
MTSGRGSTPSGRAPARRTEQRVAIVPLVARQPEAARRAGHELVTNAPAQDITPEVQWTDRPASGRGHGAGAIRRHQLSSLLGEFESPRSSPSGTKPTSRAWGFCMRMARSVACGHKLVTAQFTRRAGKPVSRRGAADSCRHPCAASVVAVRRCGRPMSDWHADLLESCRSLLARPGQVGAGQSLVPRPHRRA